MGIACNNVIAGDYKNGDIKLKGLRNDKVVLIKKGLLGKDEIVLNKSTVDHIVVVNRQYQQNGVEIYFKNGKKSMVTVDNEVLNKINAALF